MVNQNLPFLYRVGESDCVSVKCETPSMWGEICYVCLNERKVLVIVLSCKHSSHTADQFVSNT
jgi:hypothetical protein